jgi:hypothetical protein
MLDARTFLDGWTAGGSPHARLDRLLRRLDLATPVDQDSLGQDSLNQDSLGQRNQRLLALHDATGAGALEALAPCPACAAPNEFALPTDLLLALPRPEADAAVDVEGRRFRLPRMADLLSVDSRPLAERCLDGPAPAPAATVERAGRLFDQLDPAADVAVDLTCAGCGVAYRASLDVASHVAAAFDRLLARLYREIDLLAAAYGWNETAITALPAERRVRYVAMIQARREPAR